MDSSSLSSVYIALIHYPVYNKNREIVRTCLTTLDLHDIARASRTYGVRGFFIINSLATQMELAQIIVDHWSSGWGARYNPNRKEAISLVRITPDLPGALAAIREEWGRPPKIVATSARTAEPNLGYRELRELVNNRDEPYLLLFGTGWGLVEETMDTADYRLQAVQGPGRYNHLSVRSAVSIILDRILGNW